MPRKPRPWFRLYVETIHDRKIRRLDPAHRWLWVVVLAVARQSPDPGVLLLTDNSPLELVDLADEAALPERDVKRGMAALVASGMVTETDGIWSVTKWKERQFEVDNTTERTRKHRSNDERRNVPTSSVGTPPESEDRKQKTELPQVVSPTGREPDPETLDDDPRIEQAITELAQRDLDARTQATKEPIGAPDAWLAQARQRQRIRNGPRLRALAEQDPTAPATRLADWIQTQPTSRGPTSDPGPHPIRERTRDERAQPDPSPATPTHLASMRNALEAAS